MFSMRLLAPALGVVAALVYLLTRAPGLYYTDTGELAAACATLGIAHPTGYPLFTLLGHAWSMLPWPSVIVGLGILNALVVGAGVTIMAYVARDVLRRIGHPDDAPTTFISLGAAGLVGFSAVAWDAATAVEVYGLHILLLSLTLFYTLRSTLDRERQGAWTLLAGLCFGLMLTNHLSSAFLAPGLLTLWVMASDDPRARRTPRAIASVVLPAVAALVLYAYLPLRSAQHPPIDWGGTAASFHHFWYHVRGTQFGVWLFSNDKAMAENWKVFTGHIAGMTLWVGLLPMAIGLWASLTRARRVGLGLLVMSVGNLGISLGYAIPDIDAYFLPSLCVLAVMTAIGARRLADRTAWMSYVMLALPLVGIGVQYADRDRSDHRAVEAYTRWVLENAEPNAVIISHQWDYFCSAFWYLQTVEGVRPDVTLVDKELLRRTWYLPHLLRRYPATTKDMQGAVDGFMPLLMRFEREGDDFMRDRAAVAAIQERFVDVLNAFLHTNDARPLYVTPEMMNEERGFGIGYAPTPAGPLVRLHRATPAEQRLKMTHVDDIVRSLDGRTERLDEGLRGLVSMDLAQSADYALRVQHDTAAFTRLRTHVQRLDPRGPHLRYLEGLLPRP